MAPKRKLAAVFDIHSIDADASSRPGRPPVRNSTFPSAAAKPVPEQLPMGQRMNGLFPSRGHPPAVAKRIRPSDKPITPRPASRNTSLLALRGAAHRAEQPITPHAPLRTHASPSDDGSRIQPASPSPSPGHCQQQRYRPHRRMDSTDQTSAPSPARGDKPSHTCKPCRRTVSLFAAAQRRMPGDSCSPLFVSPTRMTTSQKMTLICHGGSTRLEHGSEQTRFRKKDRMQDHQLQKASEVMERRKRAALARSQPREEYVDLTQDDDDGKDMGAGAGAVQPLKMSDDLVSDSESEGETFTPEAKTGRVADARGYSSAESMPANDSFNKENDVIDLSDDQEKPSRSRLKKTRWGYDKPNLVELPVNSSVFRTDGVEDVHRKVYKGAPVPEMDWDDDFDQQAKQTEMRKRRVHAAGDANTQDAGTPKKRHPAKHRKRRCSTEDLWGTIDGAQKIPSDTTNTRKTTIRLSKADVPSERTACDDSTVVLDKGEDMCKAKYLNVLSNHQRGEKKVRETRMRPSVLSPVPMLLKKRVMPPCNSTVIDGDTMEIDDGDDDDDHGEVTFVENISKAHEGSKILPMDIPRRENGCIVTSNEPVSNMRLRPLNPEEVKEVRLMTRNVRKQQVITRVKEANITLHGEDLACLRACRWLNDEVMNSFVALINARNRDFHIKLKNENEKKGGDVAMGEMEEELRKQNLLRDGSNCDDHTIFARQRPRCHVFNTFFFTRLNEGCNYDYKGVQRWLRKAGHHIGELDMIMCPINLTNFHWVMAGIDIRNRQFLYLDSMQGPDGHGVIEALKLWLYDEVRDKVDEDTAKKMEIESWYAVINPDYMPIQQDGGSCGVFALYMAEYLERAVKPDFLQRHILTMRQRTVLMLKRGELPIS